MTSIEKMQNHIKLLENNKNLPMSFRITEKGVSENIRDFFFIAKFFIYLIFTGSFEEEFAEVSC